jgi:hypothetical protein
MWSARLRALACLLLALPAYGCGAIKRVHECEGVIGTVNDGLSELHVQVPDAGQDSLIYTHIADGYDALGKRLDALAPTDGALAKAVSGYREVTERAAKSSRAYAEALATPAGSRKERNDRQARLGRIRTQAQADLARESQAVKKLNAVCHPQ